MPVLPSSPIVLRCIGHLGALLDRMVRVSAISPSAHVESHTFPTPPSTPSHEAPPTPHDSKLDELREALQLSLASLPSENSCMQQLKWLLDVIYQALDYC